MQPKDLASIIESQLLQADASRRDVERVCAEARQFGFHSVCVNGSRILPAAALLEESEVKIAAVVGYPLGASDADAKRYETEAAVDNGAQEINTVLNIGWLKDGDDAAILRELRDIIEAADERPVGVILETTLLNLDEKVRACQLVVESGAKSVITSARFREGRATLEDVKLLRESVGARFGVTASGGVADTEAALALIEGGATRLGTAQGVAILRGLG